MIKGNTGFSLIEAMIMLVIGSVAMAGILTQIEIVSENQAFIDGKMDARALTEEVRITMESPDACLKAFGPGFFLNSGLPEGQRISRLLLANGETIQPGPQPVGRYSLVADDLRLREVNLIAGSSYRATLYGIFHVSRGRKAGLRPTVLANVKMTVDASGQLTSCSFSQNPTAVAVGEGEQICIALGGNWEIPLGKIKYSCVLPEGEKPMDLSSGGW